ncbi:hypothetical protein GCM10010251_49470 [Streptomyces aurantiogriseus]|uniref:Uncharacterized protein n=1 Tax=Streptomyces aurantiogriseus TaxID=66870 RepID=A0A918FE53_9ACTN|nr:hypothetical protein GCM10010251_49470 [Streptomyces aurantiogriseus]
MIEVSMITMNWAVASTASAHQRLGLTVGIAFPFPGSSVRFGYPQGVPEREVNIPPGGMEGVWPAKFSAQKDAAWPLSCADSGQAAVSGSEGLPEGAQTQTVGDDEHR